MNLLNKIETPKFDSIDPSVCINAKLRRLHRLINSAYQSKIKPFGLRGSMLSILFIIGKKEGVNQKTVAHHLVLDQSTISRDIKSLEKKGWIEIRKGEDSRTSELFLTNNGYTLLEQVTPVWENLHQNLEHILGDFDIQQIDNLSTLVRSNLEELKK